MGEAGVGGGTWGGSLVCVCDSRSSALDSSVSVSEPELASSQESATGSAFLCLCLGVEILSLERFVRSSALGRVGRDIATCDGGCDEDTGDEGRQMLRMKRGKARMQRGVLRWKSLVASSDQKERVVTMMLELTRILPRKHSSQHTGQPRSRHHESQSRLKTPASPIPRDVVNRSR